MEFTADGSPESNSALRSTETSQPPTPYPTSTSEPEPTALATPTKEPVQIRITTQISPLDGRHGSDF